MDNHPEIEVPNLQVIKLMQSFVSRGYVKELFAWRHYYWFLLDEGVEYLRTYLNLPAEVVPDTQKKKHQALERRPREFGDRPPRRFEGGDRDGYRRGGFGRGGGGFGGDKAGAPGGFNPEFRRGGAPPMS